MNFRRKIAIDLGTASVLVYLPNKGVVLNEPSVVAMNSFNSKIISVGKDAKKILGRTPGNIVAKKPLKDGVVADFNSTEKIISYLLKKTLGKSLIRPEVLICVPSQITQVQRRAVIQASKYAGAYNTYLIEEPLAAAIGSGIDVTDARGNIVVDIGGGTTDVAVISMGGIVINKSIPVAGDEFDKKIQDFVQTKYNMIIGESTAEKVKINVGSAYPRDDGELYEIKGRNLVNGLPMHIYVSSKDISVALKKPIDKIVDTVQEVLEQTPAELAADVYERGIIMSGGGCLLKGLDKLISERIGVNARIVDGPITAVVRGTGKSLMWMDKLKEDSDSHQDLRRKVIVSRMR